MAGQDRPQVFPANLGRIEFVSITIPRTVLISAKASAPAEITSLAISTMLVTSGVNFAIIGSSPPIFLRTASIAALAVVGWQANT